MPYSLGLWMMATSETSSIKNEAKSDGGEAVVVARHERNKIRV